MKRLLLWLVCVLFCACSKGESALTQVMVVIDAQTQVRAMTHNVDVEVRTGSGPIDQWDVRLMQSLTAGKSKWEWPLEIGLVPRDGDANRVYLAIATARDENGDAVAQVRAISGYQAGKTLTLLLLFEDACLGKADLCGEEQTCRAGECVDAHAPPKSLPSYARDADGTPKLRPFWDAGPLDAGPGTSDASSDEDAGSGNADSGMADAAVDAGPTMACNADSDCDDGDPCNGQEQCASQKCKPGKPYACPGLSSSCQQNVCVVHNGQASCEMQNIKEGERCADGDQSSDPQDTCARDYMCSSGACTAQTVDTCTATTCAALAGCDAANGCVYAPTGSTVTCDDGDMCTDGDHCSDTDTTCAGTPKNCDDGVSCTVDACDASGTCTHNADDTLCTKACNTGTCDATNDCKYTALPDFTDCDDGQGATSPDLCYRGNCTGGTRGPPSASCQVGGCGCSGFTAVRDLEYVSGSFVGLIEATQSGGSLVCNDSGPVSIVFDVTPSALTPYTIGMAKGGGLWGHSSDLVSTYAIGEGHVGVLDVGNKSVDWFGNYIDSALQMDTPSLSVFSGGAMHSQGLVFSGGSTHLWVWGHDSSTPSTARLVRCSPMTCDVAPCTPAPSCTSETTYTTASIKGVSPYTYSAGTLTLSQSYGGVVVPVQSDSGGGRTIYVDGTNQDYVPTNVATSDSSGTWYGSLRMNGTGQVLVHGTGTNNLVLCDDSGKTGSPTCKSITGLPNQGNRSYYKSALAIGGSVLMLASSCTSACIGYSDYLVVLPSGADPTVGSNWKEYFLATYSFNGNKMTANALAGGSDSFMVLGMSNGVPYVWGWAPAP